MIIGLNITLKSVSDKILDVTGCSTWFFSLVPESSFISRYTSLVREREREKEREPAHRNHQSPGLGMFIENAHSRP
jgi:hypothetical protein